MLIDTHTHIHVIEKDFEKQVEIVERAISNDVKHMINVSTSIQCYKESVKLQDRFYDNVFITAGLSPEHSRKYNDRMLSKLASQIDEGRIIAIGEIGLDFYWDYGTVEEQSRMLQDQVDLAIENDLPIIIHCRNAHKELVSFFCKQKELPRAVMHCYSGGSDFLSDYLDFGFYISFAGNVTFKNAKRLQEVCKEVPIDRLLIETDAPFLTPHPFRGKTNYPEYLVHTCDFVSELLSTKKEELDQMFKQNFNDLFKKNID